MRLTLLVALCHARTSEITGSLVELLIQLVLKIDTAPAGAVLLPASRATSERSFGSTKHYDAGMAYDRITVDPEVMGGVPTVRGLRIPVATVVSMVADGMTVEEICTDLPDLAADDVAEALRYAAEALRERSIPLRPSA